MRDTTTVHTIKYTYILRVYVNLYNIYKLSNYLQLLVMVKYVRARTHTDARENVYV